MGSKLLFQVPTELQPVEAGEKPVVAMSIDEFLDVLDFGVALYQAYVAAKEDGSINLADITKLLEPLKKLPKAVSGISLVPSELLDLDLSEADQIIAQVEERFGVDKEKAKAVIENAVKALVHLKNLIQAVS